MVFLKGKLEYVNAAIRMRGLDRKQRGRLSAMELDMEKIGSEIERKTLKGVSRECYM